MAPFGASWYDFGPTWKGDEPNMVYAKEREPEMTYPAAQALEKVGLDLAGIVMVPEGGGEEFAARCRKLVTDLANIRRMIVATRSLGVVADEHTG